VGKLDGKVTLVTGGDSGIGFATTPLGGLANPKEAEFVVTNAEDRTPSPR
jgi:NAD(P)-dependent dehydrogenase (short-subunit alcohol dehydrogenase family)